MVTPMVHHSMSSWIQLIILSSTQEHFLPFIHPNVSLSVWPAFSVRRILWKQRHVLRKPCLNTNDVDKRKPWLTCSNRNEYCQKQSNTWISSRQSNHQWSAWESHINKASLWHVCITLVYLIYIKLRRSWLAFYLVCLFVCSSSLFW